jgi:hypothetical protein
MHGIRTVQNGYESSCCDTGRSGEIIAFFIELTEIGGGPVTF